MTTQATVQVNTVGAGRATAQLRQVGGAVRGLATPLLGGGLLTGLLGGSLLSLALSGGAASNAMIRLQDRVEGLLEPVGTLANRFLDWFDDLPTGVQNVIAFSAALAGVGFAAKALGLVSLFTGVYNLIKKATTALWGFIAAQRISSRIPPPIVGPAAPVAGRRGLSPLAATGIVAGGAAAAALAANAVGSFGPDINGLDAQAFARFRPIDDAGRFINPIDVDRRAFQAQFSSPQGGVGGIPLLNAPGVNNGLSPFSNSIIDQYGGNGRGNTTINNYNTTVTPYPDNTDQRLSDVNAQGRRDGGP